MSFSDLIAKLPGYLYIKDKNSVYINATESVAKLVGWKSSLYCPGKTDYELKCKAVERADIHIGIDKKVITANTPIKTLEIEEYSLGRKILIGERSPFSDDKIQGLFGQVIDVSESLLHRAYMGLRCIDNKLFGTGAKSISYILSEKFQPLPLTSKQENCLFLLIRGKSVKRIAQRLNVSPRTIESHLEAIKNKLNCSSKSDLIEKAIDLGFTYYIPQLFQNQYIEKIL